MKINEVTESFENMRPGDLVDIDGDYEEDSLDWKMQQRVRQSKGLKPFPRKNKPSKSSGLDPNAKYTHPIDIQMQKRIREGASDTYNEGDVLLLTLQRDAMLGGNYSNGKVTKKKLVIRSLTSATEGGIIVKELKKRNAKFYDMYLDKLQLVGDRAKYSIEDIQKL